MDNPEDNELYEELKLLPNEDEDYEERDYLTSNEINQILLEISGDSEDNEIPSKDYKDLLKNNKSALYLLIYYFNDFNNLKIINKKRFEAALKEGIIVNILQFIKDYNHF